MHKDNWDDLRYVLAVAQSGSVSAAARALGVNHATVLRRIAAYEERRGSVIFEKTPRGYSIPPDRLRVIEAAKEVETAILAVNRMIEGAQTPLSGRVRVTSTDTFCHKVLPPVLAALRHEAPELQIDLVCSNARLDLARLDAEITVRPASILPAELQGDAAARLGFAAYAAVGCDDTWLGLSGPLGGSIAADWLAANVAPESFAGSADSFITLREMAANGMGRAILPCILGDSDPRLTQLSEAAPRGEVAIWVASHADLANVPRILAVRKYLVQALGAMAGSLAGVA